MKKLSVDDQEPSAVMPTSCPFCGSPRVAPTTEKIDVFTYWRCTMCGEMWNVARLGPNNHRRGFGGR